MKIGKLIFSKKAIQLIAFCLFLKGVVIGATAAIWEDGGIAWAVPLMAFAMFLPYATFGKKILKNIN